MKYIVLTIFLACQSMSSLANSSNLLAEELANVMHIKETVVKDQEEKIIAVLKDFRAKYALSIISSSFADAKLKSYEEEATASLMKLYSSEEYKSQAFALYVELFRKKYTTEELQAMISFYQSPMGQQILQKQNSFDYLLPEILNSVIEDLSESEEIRSMVHGTYTEMIIADFERLGLNNEK